MITTLSTLLASGRYLPLVLLISLLGSPLFAEQLANEKLVKDALSKRVKPSDPGVAIGIIVDGKIVVREFAGKANLDYGIPVTHETSFNIASNAKQFTAASILLLEREKKLSLDDDFRKFVPEVLKLNKEKISIRNLLTHTSGIRDVYDLWALQGKTWWQTFVSNDDALTLLKAQRDLNFKPGTDYLYSNSNYILLAEVIRAVTKVSLKEFAKQRLFDPLGMTNTRFADNYMDPVPNRADAYGNFDGWKRYPWITNTYGDGALFTTIDDQVAWELHLSSPKLWDAAFSERLSSSIRLDRFDSYGFGVMFEKFKGIEHAYHDGSTGAYNASFARFPTERLSVVVMSNNGSIGTRSLALELAQIFIDKSKLKESANGVTEAVGQGVDEPIDIFGDYAFGDGSLIKIRSDGTTVLREIYGREPAKLKRVSRSVFDYVAIENLKLYFDMSGGKAIALTIVAPGQGPQRAERLPAASLETVNYKKIDGRFVDPETGTFIELTYKDGQDFNLNKNGRSRLAKLVRPDQIRMNSYVIFLNRDTAGEVVGLTVNNNRIRNVKFYRQT